MSITRVRAHNGAEITVCAEHHQQICPYCCLCFEEPNQEAIAEQELQNNIQPDGKKFRDGVLLTGTKVVSIGEELTLKCTVKGIFTMGDYVDSDFAGLECYVLKFDDRKAAFMAYPVEDLHDEWLVESNGSLVDPTKYIALVNPGPHVSDSE